MVTWSQRSNGAKILKDIGFSVTEWCELYLLRQPVGGREITVALDKYTTDREHRIVRRSNLCHSLRHGSFPARPADGVLASLGSRGAFADVGKISSSCQRRNGLMIACTWTLMRETLQSRYTRLRNMGQEQRTLLFLWGMFVAAMRLTELQGECPHVIRERAGLA